MKLSIITVTKNNKSGLLRAIECVRNQTYKNVEHIIVDGGSTDGSVDILRSEQKEINKGSVIPANEVRQESTSDSGQAGMTDSGLRPSLTRSRLKSDRNDTNSKKTEPLTTNYSLLAISEPDNGIYDAINKGIKLATGDVIGLLHSDDLYADENVLERYAEIFNSDSGQVRRDFVQPGRAGMTKQIEAVYSDLVYVRKKQEARSQELGSDSGPVYTPFRRG
ncbi:MAG TPA: glycosyltransferase, partial [Ignavibacteriaceae bacterium]|nr:glycosyltransferase [Ignavibacteriaceae bacterium]